MALRDVIGQDRSIRILSRTIERGRVPSAYLFAGESGIGKKFTAINLAKALNCLYGSDGLSAMGSVTEETGLSSSSHDAIRVDACDACPSCKKMDAATHPDLALIAPEKGEIRVGEIRELEEVLSLKPFEGSRKVVIIDDADAMNPSAANAFLKTLEEPPDGCILILVTARPDKLPETVRSRCCRISFVPLSTEACERVILKVASRDRKGGEDLRRRAHLLARLSLGRPGLVISSDAEKEGERFTGLLKSMLYGDGETWADREEMEKWLDTVSFMLRDMVVLKLAEEACEDKSSSDLVGYDGMLLRPDMKDFALKMTKTIDMRGIINIYDRMVYLKGQMGFNLNKAITWNYTASVLKGAMVKG